MSLTIEALCKAQLHVGSLKNEASPKTRKFWHGVQRNVVVINPEMIKPQLEAAQKRIKAAQAEKKQILVVCDKSMYLQELEAMSEKYSFHYLNAKVPGGFLTNFDTLMRRIKDLNSRLLFIDSEDFLRMTKKEQVAYKRDVTKIQQVYGGVRKLTNKPDLVVVIDGTNLTNFLRELKKEKIDNVVCCSTDFAQWRDESKLLVANMKSHTSLDFIMNALFSA
jgi:small subunit ribosomal protein S2